MVGKGKTAPAGGRVAGCCGRCLITAGACWSWGSTPGAHPRVATSPGCRDEDVLCLPFPLREADPPRSEPPAPSFVAHTLSGPGITVRWRVLPAARTGGYNNTTAEGVRLLAPRAAEE